MKRKRQPGLAEARNDVLEAVVANYEDEGLDPESKDNDNKSESSDDEQEDVDSETEVNCRLLKPLAHFF